jgi:hypothetical protein
MRETIRREQQQIQEMRETIRREQQQIQEMTELLEIKDRELAVALSRQRDPMVQHVNNPTLVNTDSPFFFFFLPPMHLPGERAVSAGQGKATGTLHHVYTGMLCKDVLHQY